MMGTTDQHSKNIAMLPEAWSIKTKSPVSCLTLPNCENRLVGAIGFKLPTISCWSLDNRHLLWSITIPQGVVSSRSVDFLGYKSHALAANSDGIVYMTCGGKIGEAWSNLLFLNSVGEICKKQSLPERVQKMVIIDHKVFVLSRDAYLNVFDLEGNLLWNYFLPHPPDSSYEYAHLLGPKGNRLGYVRGSKYRSFDLNGNIVCEWTFPCLKEAVGWIFDEEETIEEYMMVRQLFGAGDLLGNGGALLQSTKGHFFQISPEGICSGMGTGPHGRNLIVLKNNKYCFSNGIELKFAENSQVLKTHKLKPTTHNLIYAEKSDLFFAWGGHEPSNNHLSVFSSSGEIVWSSEGLEHLRCGALEENGLVIATGSRITYLPYKEFMKG